MQWDLGVGGIGVLVAMSVGFGLFSLLVAGWRTRWMFPIAAFTVFVTGLVTSEIWFGWATEEDLQPNIDGLSFDEAFIFGVLAGVVSIVVTRRLTRTRSPMVRGEIVIRRPPRVVFDVVADERNEPSYNPTLLSSQMLTPEPLGVGSRFRALHASARGPLEMTVEITAYDPPHRIASVTTASWADVDGAVTFEEVGESATRMRWSWHVRPKGFARLLTPLVGVVGSRGERACWQGLKRYLESTDVADRPLTGARS
jgi:uncharacterized protein YndB with AHSA1/START domain